MVETKTDEPELNVRLADILKTEYDMDAVPQADVGLGGNRIDVMITITGHGGSHVRLALEMEKDGSGKKGQAVKDAASRLNPNKPQADIAIAGIYPKSCRKRDDLAPDTVIEYLHIRNEYVRKYTRDGRHDYKLHAKRAVWRRITVKDIPTYFPIMYKEAGRPDIIAEDLNGRLDAIVNGLDVDEMKLLATSLKFNYEGDDKREAMQLERARNGAKRALLVVAGAALFHTQLKDLRNRRPKRRVKEWPPHSLDRCISSPHIRQELIKAWRLIWELDYRTIFESAISVLESCTGPRFKMGIISVAEWASGTADDIGGLRHDILGRIFHRVLDTAQQDGSYYTSTAAAAFLATLAIPKDQCLKDYQVIDPACGTGTLLMASSERLRKTADDFDPTVLIDNAIHGVDINTTACHMAATTLGLLSPNTDFGKMNVHTMEFDHVDNAYRAGSLEMYSEDGLLPFVNWSGAAGTQVETGSRPKESWHGRFSLIIMNPPFTRNSLRHDQFSPEVEAGIKKREADLFSKAPKGLRHSSHPMFMLLSEKLLSRHGTLATINPMSVASSAGALKLREFLAEHFHIEVIVVSFDPHRIYFSENTKISEFLLVARRGQKKAPTKIVKLAVNPSNEADAIRCAESLNHAESPPHCNVSEWPSEHMRRGDWTITQFYSNHLVDTFMKIRASVLFETVRLGDIVKESEAPQGVRMLFSNSESRPADHPAWPTKWTHKTSETETMHAVPNSYLVRNMPTTKKYTEKQWKKIADTAWSRRGLLHITEKVQLDLVRVFAITNDSGFIGSAWHSLTPKPEMGHDVHAWSKAMTVYLNSTLGVIAMLGVRTFKKLPYPRWGVENVRSIPVPTLDAKQVAVLAASYDKLADQKLGLLRQPTNARGELDRAVGKALGVSINLIAAARLELSNEPMITARQYGSGTLD